MNDEKANDERLWLLRGDHLAEGWQALEADARADKVRVVIFDRTSGWALVRGAEGPTRYEGMRPEAPRDGLYVSEHGYPIYVVESREVSGPRAVISAVGGEAEQMLAEIGDPDTVLERLGLAY